MSNEKNTELSVNIAQEILGSPSPAAVEPEPPAATASPSAAPVGAPLALSQESVSSAKAAGARTVNSKYPGLGTKWRATEEVWPGNEVLEKKTFKKHSEALAAGTPVEDIRHVTMGIWNGCQCPDCKTKRFELFPETDSQASSGPTPLRLPSLIDEEIAGRILNLPNRIGEVFSRVTRAPKEVVDVWTTAEKDLEIMGRYGKALEQRYMNMPNFQHKELLEFSIWYFGELGVRVSTTIMILKMQKTESEKKK
jgi:hypothetical protein